MNNQTISCQVANCAYNQNKTHTCGLDCILINSCSACGGTQTAENTKCSSYKCKFS